MRTNIDVDDDLMREAMRGMGGCSAHTDPG